MAKYEVSYMQLQHALVRSTPEDRLYKWMCHKVVYSCWCMSSRSILHSSWFSCSHLTLLEVLLCTCSIIRRVLNCAIELKLRIQQTSISAWINFCCKAVLVYVRGTCQKLGGWGRTMEIVEGSFWKYKYNTSKLYKGRLICSGIECQLGISLVPILDCTADTLSQFHQDMDLTRYRYCQWLLVELCGFAGWGYMHLTDYMIFMISFIDQHIDIDMNLHEDMS